MIKTQENKERFNIYISSDLKDRIEMEASKLCMSKSAFIIMAVNQYFQTADSVSSLSTMLDALKLQGKI